MLPLFALAVAAQAGADAFVDWLGGDLEERRGKDSPPGILPGIVGTEVVAEAAPAEADSTVVHSEARWHEAEAWSVEVEVVHVEASPLPADRA